jgi:indole-3-glycerol phosphate synthase
MLTGILAEIVQNKKNELKEVKSNKNLFKKIFAQKNANIMGEIKLASPKFDYSARISLDEIFKFYGENELIKAVSVLIDKKYFK